MIDVGLEKGKVEGDKLHELNSIQNIFSVCRKN